MGMNTIKSDNNWGTATADLNNNFASITAELEKLKAANQKFKGFYTSATTLNAANPRPSVGDSAWVGEVYPGVVYECNSSGVWANTNKAPVTPSVSLADYVPKTLLDVRTTEYNVSVQHPSSGIYGTNKFTLAGAIALVPASLRTVALKCSFLNASGTVETWEFQGGSFTDTNSWAQGGAQKVSELRDNMDVLNTNLSKVIKNEHEADEVKFSTLWGDAFVGARGASYIYKNRNYKYVKATVNADIATNTSVIGLYSSDIISRETLVSKIQSDGSSGKRTVMIAVPENCVTIIVCNYSENMYKRDYPSISIFREEHYELNSIANRVTAIEERNESIDSKDTTNIVCLNNEGDTVIQLNQMKYLFGSPSGTHKTGTPILFGWISDLHGDSLSMGRFVEFCRHYSTYIDDMISTGDQIEVYTDDFSFWDKDIMVAIGNHDIQNKSYVETMSQSDANAKFIAPFSGNWGVKINSGANYYYKDYKDSGDNIRMVVLDCIFWSGAQKEWLSETLADAKTSGCAVMIAAHYPGGEMSLFENTAWNTFNRNVTKKYTNSVAAESIQKFISEGGSFVAWIVGHSHSDFIGTLKDYPDQLCIILGLSHSTTDDINGSITRGTTHSRAKGTKSMDLFNVIGVSTARKTVSIIRIGSDVDTYFRKMSGICIRYDINNIVSM